MKQYYSWLILLSSFKCCLQYKLKWDADNIPDDKIPGDKNPVKDDKIPEKEDKIPN